MDVPGYGYAKSFSQKQNVRKWGKMIETYITQREQLRAVVSLIDFNYVIRRPKMILSKMYGDF